MAALCASCANANGGGASSWDPSPPDNNGNGQAAAAVAVASVPVAFSVAAFFRSIPGKIANSVPPGMTGAGHNSIRMLTLYLSVYCATQGIFDGWE